MASGKYSALALILLFIAPSAWGQYDKPCEPDEYQAYTKERGVFCEKPQPQRLNLGAGLTGIGGTGPKALQCETGWIPVRRLDTGGGAWCAWVLKEPIWK